MMADLAAQNLEDPYQLSGVPLILTDREWADWVPPEGHPAHSKFKNMETNWLGRLYAEQKELLNKIHERDGLDLYVSNFSAVQENESGDVVSYCVWGEVFDCLLPVTHEVAFM